MRDRPVQAISIRIALLVALLFTLGLSARPKRLAVEWLQVNQAEESGQPGPAALSLARISAAQPWRTDLYYRTAQYALQAEYWVLGLDSLGHMDPADLSAADWTAMGDAYLELSQPERAIQAWGRSMAVTENPEALSRLYAFHRQQHDASAILADLWVWHRLQPADAGLAYQLVVHLAAAAPHTALTVIAQTNIEDEAIQPKLSGLQSKLQAATQRASPSEQMLGAGQALAELGEWELAVQAIRQALQLDPQYAEAWAFLGEARQHLPPTVEGALAAETALDDLRQALRLNPDSVAANSLLALYWQRQGDFTRAADLYHHTAALDPKNPAWFAALGSLASVQGNLASAEGYFQYAASLAEQETVYWRLLAGFYISNQIHVADKALAAANKAVNIAPDDPANLDILAQVRFHRNEINEAQRLLDEALQKNPRYAPAYLHLGMVYLLQEQGELAHYYLEQAVLRAQDQATTNQAQRLLEYYFP